MTDVIQWSAEQDAVLIARYPQEGASPALRNLFGKTREIIKRRAYRLRLRVNRCAISTIRSRASGRGVANRCFRGCGRVTLTYVTGLRRKAKERGLECPILDGTNDSLRYLDSIASDTCSLSGLPLVFPSRSRDRSATASLDRINPKQGYVRGNVRWIHKDINEMKWALTDEEFLSLIQDIAATHPFHA